MSEDKTNKQDLGSLFILVIGATGNQGGAVSRALLERGHKVRALTRNKESFKAKELEKLGAELFEGDIGDAASLQEAMKGVDAAFGVTTPFEKGVNFEEKSGFLMEFAVNTIGVRHFVFSSIASADQHTGIPHFESKYRIEQHLQINRTPFTIIRPVFFMENFLAPWILPELKKGRIAMAMPPDKKLQMITLEDLASFVVYVFENRGDFLYKTIELASDELAAKEYTSELSKAIGIHIEYQELTYDDIKGMGEDFVRMHKWLNDVGYNVDIQKLQRTYSEINWHKFGEWAKNQYWNIGNEPVQGKII